MLAKLLMERNTYDLGNSLHILVRVAAAKGETVLGVFILPEVNKLQVFSVNDVELPARTSDGSFDSMQELQKPRHPSKERSISMILEITGSSRGSLRSLTAALQLACSYRQLPAVTVAAHGRPFPHFQGFRGGSCGSPPQQGHR